MVDAFDVAVEIVVDGGGAARVADRLVDVWELCSPSRSRTAEATVLACFDEDPTVREAAVRTGRVTSERLDDLLQLVTQQVTFAAITARAGTHLMLHGACLADPRTGVAAAFVAAGGTGKTTFVRTHGPGRWYVTDETTVIRADGVVLPYPKPLSVRRAPDSALKDEIAPGALGLRAPEGPVRLGALCLLDRDDNHAGPPQVDLLGTLDAIVALVPQSSHLPEMARPLQRLAALCESVGGVHRVTYREAAEVADVVAGLVEGRR